MRLSFAICRFAAADPFTSLCGFFRVLARARVTALVLRRRFAGEAARRLFVRVAGDTGPGILLTVLARRARGESRAWVATVCCAHPANPPGGIKIFDRPIFYSP